SSAHVLARSAEKSATGVAGLKATRVRRASAAITALPISRIRGLSSSQRSALDFRGAGGDCCGEADADGSGKGVPQDMIRVSSSKVLLVTQLVDRISVSSQR